MTQSLIDLTKVKDRDTTAALDVAGTIMTNAGLTAAGLGIKGQVAGAAAAAGQVGEVMGDMVFGTGTTATVTMTSANPGVVTWTTHGFSTNIPQPVVFTTSGALPTNIVSGTVYYTIPTLTTASTFQVATTVANAIAATAIDMTAGAQSGTQTGTAGTSMANTTAINVTGMALTPGIWEIWAQLSWNLNAATTWTKLEVSISQTTATLATSGAVRGTTYGLQAQISAAATNGVGTSNLGPAYLNVSVATNIFLVVKGTFATNIAGAYGYLFANRIG